MSNRIHKLGLGTAQFGLDYGISNKHGQTPLEEVRSILQTAADAGIRLLDTASQYGESETVLGRTLPETHNFQIVTKTPSFRKNRIGPAEARELKETFRQSLDLINQKSLYGLMIHHADDLLAPSGEYLFEAMQDLQEKGLVEKVGASIYHAAQIDGVINRHKIDLIQVPLNILDQRLIQSGHLKALENMGVEVHARSIFLQGLLLMNPDDLPEQFDTVRDNLKNFHSDCAEHNVSPLSACIDFVLRLCEINRAVVGICLAHELKDILDTMRNDNAMVDYDGHAWQDELVLNPANWRNSSI